MHGQEPSSPADNQHRQQLVIWLAMVMSLVMYFLILRLVPAPVTEGVPGLVTGLMVVAIGLVALSFLVKSRMASRGDGEGPPRQSHAAMIVPVAMCEAAALFGVVVWFVAGSVEAYYFLLLGLVGMLLHYPKREA